jgi:hypothetical protein
VLSAQARVEANPLDTKAIASVRLFENQLQKSVQALKNLGDASNLNASIMERLNKLDSDRQGRLGLGEQFFGASPAERQKLGENAGFAAKALQHGTLDKLTPEQQQKAVSFFQSSRDVRLFGGDKTGGQHLTALINNSAGGVFRQTAQDQAAVKGLEGAAAGNHARAVQAQNGVAAVQGQNFADLAKGINASAAAFNQSIGTFGRNVDNFAKAAASIPHAVAFNGSVKHEIVINGAQMLQELMPNIARLVDSSARQIVDERIRKSLGLGQAQIS